jgi:hypothetical protein
MPYPTQPASAWHNRRPTLNLPRLQTSFNAPEDAYSEWQAMPQGARSAIEHYHPWPSPIDDRPPPHSAHDAHAPFFYLPPIQAYPPYPAQQDPHMLYDPHQRGSFFENAPYPTLDRVPSPGIEQSYSERESEGRERSPSTASSHPSPNLAERQIPKTARRSSGQRDRLSPPPGDVKEGKYACQFCSKRFTRPSSLKIHSALSRLAGWDAPKLACSALTYRRATF